MAKIDWNEVHGDRIKQIDKEIKVATRKKFWGIKKMLEYEKDELIKSLGEAKTKEG
ncbi:MAG: hypothetical protein H7Y18_11890 [Clostridiaceae bacterium]|nr:hypothetical protein [Clostridiaceae bacterium]